ncbi:MAG TPA: hypothetical protein VGM97_13585 [Steroidobacteraceae bacterium]
MLLLLITNWIHQRHSVRQLQEIPPTRTSAHELLGIAIVGLIVTVALGICTEIIQWTIGRDAEVDDVVHDALGAGSAAALWLYWHQSRVGSVTVRYGLLLLSVGCAILWSLPLLACGFAYWDRAARFPVIGEFTSQGDLYLTEIRGSPAGITPADVTAAAAPQSPALEIALQGDRWPGVTLIEPEPDWAGYRTLVVEVSTATARPLQVNVRVDDSPEWNGANAYTGGFACAPRGLCVQSIPLDTLMSSQGRRLDLRHISRVIVFHNGPAPGERLRIHRVWLAR